MSDINKLEGHTGSTFHGVFVTTGGTETAVTTKWDKFHFSTGGAPIHGSAKGRIATIYHLFHVFDNGSTWM